VTVRNERNEVIASTTTVPEPEPQAMEDQANVLVAQMDQLTASYPPTGTPPAGSADAQQLAQLRQQFDALLASGTSGGACVVAFSAPVPDAQSYQIRVGTHETPPYSFSDLQERGFRVGLSLK
jgi:hypothetical protein